MFLFSDAFSLFQEVFPQRWAPALRAAKSFLSQTMFTQRPAVAEFVGFIEAAKHCIHRLGKLEQGDAALANARFAAVECLNWIGTGDLGRDDWGQEIALASSSSRSDVRDAALALKDKVAIWEFANISPTDEEEPQQLQPLNPPAEERAMTPVKTLPVAAPIKKRQSSFQWLVRLILSGTIVALLFKYRTRIWEMLAKLVNKK